MAKPNEIRELALRVLYERDAGGADAEFADPAEVSEQPDRFKAGDVRKVLALAEAAHAGRAEADARVEKLAPTWPSSRQPAVDRAILRIAIAELRAGVARSIVINEAVELAKQYSTEKSPGFINGVLDKIADQLGDLAPAGGDAFGTAGTGEGEQDAGTEAEAESSQAGPSPSGGDAWPS
jgi:N utilization substance protein B